MRRTDRRNAFVAGSRPRRRVALIERVVRPMPILSGRLRPRDRIWRAGRLARPPPDLLDPPTDVRDTRPRVDDRTVRRAAVRRHAPRAAHRADGVDEMVCGFINRYAEHLRADDASTIRLHATDTGGRWVGAPRLRGPDVGSWTWRGMPGSQGRVGRGHGGELFLLLWNRRSAVTSTSGAIGQRWRTGGAAPTGDFCEASDRVSELTP